MESILRITLNCKEEDLVYADYLYDTCRYMDDSFRISSKGADSCENIIKGCMTFINTKLFNNVLESIEDQSNEAIFHTRDYRAITSYSSDRIEAVKDYCYKFLNNENIVIYGLGETEDRVCKFNNVLDLLPSLETIYNHYSEAEMVKHITWEILELHI